MLTARRAWEREGCEGASSWRCEISPLGARAGVLDGEIGQVLGGNLRIVIRNYLYDPVLACNRRLQYALPTPQRHRSSSIGRVRVSVSVTTAAAAAGKGTRSGFASAVEVINPKFILG